LILRKTLIVLILLSFFIPTFSQIQLGNISFPKFSSWEYVIKKDRSENKYIMVDLSTEWFSWCKVMDKQHFTDPEVLSLMQPKLNSYMLDAEKDSIG
jgi:thioredoxin-related protein